MKLVWFALALALCSCSDRDHAHARASEVAPDRTPRVLDPPPQHVRALPPHAIRSDGVGPYRLGLTLEQLGTQVPPGGRNAQIDIPNVVHLSVLHAEDDTIQIGGEPLGRASFVAVIGPKVARTESGIQVGSTRAELVQALGAPEVVLTRARDPRIVVPSNLRELRAVLDHDHVIGLVVTASDPPGKAEGCVRPAPGPATEGTKFGACLTGAAGVVTVDGDEIVARMAETDKLIDRVRLANLQFAAAVRAPDGKDEIVAITRLDDSQARTWWLVGYRLEAGKLVQVANGPVYQLTATNARWIGSTLADLDLILEVSNRGDTFEVGGLLTHRTNGRLRDLLVLSPVQVPRHRAKSATLEREHDAQDAGVTPPIDSDDNPAAQ
ncbi:MAG: hypothetical protein ABI467_31630 [Kofleriaceae bacterium]